MSSYINMIEMINHFEDEYKNDYSIFNFIVDKKLYFHNYMMKCLISAVKSCITNDNLIKIDTFEYDEMEDFEMETIQILNEAFKCQYGSLNSMNIKLKMKSDGFLLHAPEEFTKKFDNLTGLDMISLIQELICSVDDDDFNIQDFDADDCFLHLTEIYVNSFIQYHEDTKDQYVDCKIQRCKRYLDETCLMAFHSPHTEIGKRHIKNLYEELQEL